jgi:hypothetical protein
VTAYFWVKEERIDLWVKEERVDGAATEGAIMDAVSDGAAMEDGMVDALPDDVGACRKSRPLTRPRSDTLPGDVSLGGGGSSEGSMPPSSYERE